MHLYLLLSLRAWSGEPPTDDGAVCLLGNDLPLVWQTKIPSAKPTVLRAPRHEGSTYLFTCSP